MFTFNFTFHVPNPFSMSTLTSVANAATDAFSSVATDIREDPELLNYMVAGFGPEGVAGGFDSNRLVKSPPFASSSSSPTSPKSKGLKGARNRHAVGLGLANLHAQNRKRYSPGQERDLQGSTSGFVNANPSHGSGTPMFPTQAYSQFSSCSDFGVHGLGQEARSQLHQPFPASRKRGWVPAPSESTTTNDDFTTGSFDAPKHPNDVNDMGSVASMQGFDYDGCGMGSGVGDRRKWDDGDEDENAMEAGESLGFLYFCFCTFHPQHSRRCLCGPGGRKRYVKSAEKGRETDLLWARCLPAFVYPRTPSCSPSPHSPIQLSVRMGELLVVLVSFAFSLFLVFILLPLTMLYHSQFLFDTDILLLVKSELPPAKRRKGLAGTIVSTALSAALIGTAVGLTVYRL